MTENAWLLTNEKRVEAVIRQCEEQRFMSNVPSINFVEVIMLFGGALVEIRRLSEDDDRVKKLETENTDLKAKNKELEEKVVKLKGVQYR